jgi:hypothetical protein
MKFIKPHLGSDDVMAGDPSNEVNEDTKVNVDKVFEDTGKSALAYQEKYGNHLPWFIIKEIVGNEIWDSYTKFTIERSPKDRMVSLFCFLNSILIKPGLFLPSPELRSRTKGPEMKEMLSQSLLGLYPEEIRSYFEDWALLQLSAEELPLTDHDTYGVAALEKERAIYKKQNQKLGFKLYDIDKEEVAFTPPSGIAHSRFPYLSNPDIYIRMEPFVKHQNTEGQCRFLNYGYYYDGKDLAVDNIIDFKHVADNIGKFFKNNSINIKCNKSIYDSNSQNVHYRKNTNAKSKDWWFDGARGSQINGVIEKKFKLLSGLIEL